MHEEDVRVIGRCAECQYKITSTMEECYCNDDGEYFCDIECVLEHCGIYKLEI